MAQPNWGLVIWGQRGPPAAFHTCHFVLSSWYGGVNKIESVGDGDLSLGDKTEPEREQGEGVSKVKVWGELESPQRPPMLIKDGAIT